MNKRMTRSDMATIPMSATNEAVDIRWRVTAEEYESIQMGKELAGQADGFFIYFEADCLFVHEPSGICIYQILFSRQDGHHVAHKLIIEKDPKRRESRGSYFEKSSAKNILLFSLGVRSLL